MITESALKEFKAESKKWLDDGLGFLTTPIKYVELLELTERLIAAEKDAARWNYVINNSCIGGMSMSLVADYNYGVDVVAPDDAVAIVDEAMKCKQK